MRQSSSASGVAGSGTCVSASSHWRCRERHIDSAASRRIQSLAAGWRSAYGSAHSRRCAARHSRSPAGAAAAAAAGAAAASRRSSTAAGRGGGEPSWSTAALTMIGSAVGMGEVATSLSVSPSRPNRDPSDSNNEKTGRERAAYRTGGCGIGTLKP